MPLYPIPFPLTSGRYEVKPGMRRTSAVPASWWTGPTPCCRPVAAPTGWMPPPGSCAGWRSGDWLAGGGWGGGAGGIAGWGGRVLPWVSEEVRVEEAVAAADLVVAVASYMSHKHTDQVKAGMRNGRAEVVWVNRTGLTAVRRALQREFSVRDEDVEVSAVEAERLRSWKLVQAESGGLELAGRELHCGDGIALLGNGTWEPVRVEWSERYSWYAVCVQEPGGGTRWCWCSGLGWWSGGGTGGKRVVQQRRRPFSFSLLTPGTEDRS